MYIVAATAIHMYDMKTGAIAQSNPVMQAIQAYADEKTAEKRAQEGNENYTFTYAPKDVEVFRGKSYFGLSGVGFVEYDPKTQEVVIFDSDYIKAHVSKTVGEPDLSITATIRSMRSFDDFLALGTSRALMKFDGTGYPEGLKGEDIPYVARIICCADCFDAMASKRVYKEPFSLEKIISEFERCSGTQFDPKISKVVVDLIVTGKLKPYTAENTYLGSDGKTHRIKQNEE
ncbi:MAG: hypothetical protein IJU20_02150 [Clostridia bacterium]|nr:hypothetical protein [Clostridia bacterium]